MVAACLMLLSASGGHAQPEKKLFIPRDDQVLLIIGQDKDSITGYINSVSTVPAGLMVYTSIQEMDGLSAPAIDRGAGIQDAAYLIKKYPNTVIQLGLYMKGALEGVIAGNYDRNIEKLARWIAKAAVPVYLRIGYEFDLLLNEYEPEAYKAAYRHIVDRLNGTGLKNVIYVWHSYGVLNPERPIELWYPGDDAVDWIGISYFKTYFQEDREVIARFAAKKNKPLMIAEAAPSEIGVGGGAAAWKKWFAPFFAYIEKHNVRAVCYINTDWDSHPMFAQQSWGDSRVQANPEILSLWKAAVGQGRFLQSSYKLFKQLQ